jgi:hypothetical protein
MPGWTIRSATRGGRFPARTTAVAMLVALLIACGGAAPAAPGGSPSAAALPNGSTSARPSPSSAGPDPDAAAAVDAFRAFIQTNPSFHIVGDMLMTIRTLTLQAAIVSDVSHGDEQGTIDLRGGGVSIHLAVILVDGTVYLRLGRGEWQTASEAAGFSNPLGGLAVEGLTVIDRVNVAGTLTHHLRAENPEGLNGQTLSGNTLTDLTIESSSLDVYITDDGVPLKATVKFSGTGIFGGEQGAVVTTIRYDFSKFDQEIEILAPIAASP